MFQTEHTYHFLHITIIIIISIIYYYTVYHVMLGFHLVYTLTGEILSQETY